MNTKHKEDSSKGRLAPRERLLDAAESLFAKHGYHGVKVREITTMAKTRLADVNERFGSKEALFREVVSRRASVINADRLAMLSEIRPLRSKSKQVRSIVEAFAEPMLKRSYEGQGWRNYFRLSAQLMIMRSAFLLVIADQYNPIASAFTQQLAKTLPHLTQRQLFNAYQFMVSTTLTVFSDNRRTDVLSDFEITSKDFSAHYDDVVTFATGGIMALRN